MACIRLDLSGSALRVRRATAADEPFLRRAFDSTREDLLLLPLDPAGLRSLLDLQYRCREIDYARRYPEAERLVVEREGEAVGTLLCAELSEATYLVDIALIPEARNQGIGTELLRALQRPAAALPLSLHVLKTNKGAKRLYERLGFRSIRDEGVGERMDFDRRL